MVKTIVVPFDGSASSDRALSLGASLADQLGNALTLVSAVTSDEEPARRRALGEVSARFALPESALRVVTDRSPADAVLLVAEEADDPAICMATRARPAPAAVVLGSVADAVVRAGVAPVVLAGPELDAPPARVASLVVCLDGSSTSEGVLPVAREWAHGLHVPVHLVQVVEPGAVEGLYVVDGETPVTEERLRVVAADLASDGLTVTWHVERALDPAHAVVRYARTLPSPLVALATHGRSALARLALGSVAAGVVRHAPFPVLVVRPSRLEG